MSRLPLPADDDVAPEAKEIFASVIERFGVVPNVIRTMATSTTVLTSIVDFQFSLSNVLDFETRNAIALAVSGVDDCTYCRNLHAHIATRFASTPEDEIERNLAGSSSVEKRAAAATFAARVISTRGHVSDEELAAVREAGYNDAEILEIVAWAVATLATNLINNVAGTTVDLTAASARSVA